MMRGRPLGRGVVFPGRSASSPCWQGVGGGFEGERDSTSVSAIPNLSNLRLLLARFALVGKGCSPCSEHPSATSIAAQQNR